MPEMPAPMPQLQRQILRQNWGSLWSSWLFTNAAGTVQNVPFEYFSVKMGGNGQGYPGALTLVETNMRSAGQMSAQQGMSVHAIAFSLHNYASQAPVSQADFHNLVDGAVAQWNWQQSQTDIAPLAMLGSGGAGGYGIGGTVGAVAAELNLGNGGCFILRQPVELAPLATFTIRVQYPNSGKTAPAVSTVGRMTLIGEIITYVDAG